MMLECVPLKEIIINKIRLPFGIPRELVRAKLGVAYDEQNEEVLLENEDTPIFLRRDLYNQLHSNDSYFFLHYDQNNFLFELEVHHCKKIKLFGIEFNFMDEAELIANELSQHAAITEEKEGYWHFGEIRIHIMNETQMGEEENSKLGYFCCSAGELMQ
ncbi:hypothetical protein [Pseudobacter ginsenosidimutans]|uniref:Uncharacterized protein n=1 Tax=Pseudobacter ginsenosidimutans TaxID=661488 RepID=A0A4Q7N584_9BACT|nr:hypothetical protein [Pseudobacter ginsenosidimutans]QEC44697.1 hypothetical protein FSB84_24555 [Pseudobacter ginsenosidimutans]RZS76178.1 hypothetical protein EV199_2057 [Pseudobacter ginsenosidimutans]